MRRAFVALGSNLGKSSQQIEAALIKLSHIPETSVLCCSSLYRTSPVGYVEQPDFINAVAELDTALNPLPLLKELLQLEVSFGRIRSTRNAPRIIDLDLLWYQDVRMATCELILPHPRMLERAFVMVPLAQIAPELDLSPNGTAASIACKLDSTGVYRLTE